MYVHQHTTQLKQVAVLVFQTVPTIQPKTDAFATPAILQVEAAVFQTKTVPTIPTGVHQQTDVSVTHLVNTL